MDFDVKKITNEMITFIRNYYKENDLKGAVIGISGGKDSAVVAGLFSKAIGSENVYGLWIPCHSNNLDMEDAIKVANKFGFVLDTFDLTNIYDTFVKSIKEEKNASDEILIDANINLKPRLRMSTLYYYASMLSNVKHGTYIVPGTSNKSELFVGYFTKGGDNVADIRLLANLTVNEVIQIGDYIGVPYSICHKIPNDGLSGKSDEEKLGVKYTEINEVINEQENGIKSRILDDEVRNKILNMHQKNKHKFDIPTFVKGDK